MSVIPESHADILDKLAFAHIATVTDDGELNSSPVWIGWDGTNVKFSLTKGRKKYANLQANPVIALSLTDPDNPYRYLEVRGRVTSVEDDSSNAFIDSMAKKYMGEDHYPWHQPGDERVVMVVTPEKTSQMG